MQILKQALQRIQRRSPRIAGLERLDVQVYAPTRADAAHGADPLPPLHVGRQVPQVEKLCLAMQ
jgi:hypothetical protein